jgi:hypothetical protein
MNGQEHAHAWQPIDGARGRYACLCGATGFRKGADIQPHKTRLRAKVDPSHVGASNLSNGNARRGRRSPGSW